LYKTVDNRKTLEQQNAMIAKRLDESLAARLEQTNSIIWNFVI